MKKLIPLIFGLILMSAVAIAAPVSSGTSAVATSGDAAVNVVTVVQVTHLVIVNEGTAKGFFSIDGGTTWFYLPAGSASAPSSVSVNTYLANVTIQVKRVASGTDLSGVYAFGY